MRFYRVLKESLPILLPTPLFLLVQGYSLSLGLNFEEGREGVAYLQGLSGLLPYWDFEWMYGPLAFFIYSPLIGFFGDDLITLRLVYLVLSALLIQIGYWVSRRLMPAFWASVAAFLCAAFIQIPFYT